MIRHENDKWVLFDKDGEKHLGELDTVGSRLELAK